MILASDHDVIRDEHTVEIYHHIPNSQLAIFPNATHMVPFDDPGTFNATVERFFRTPFVKKDRIKDMLASLEKTARLVGADASVNSQPNAVPRSVRAILTDASLALPTFGDGRQLMD